MSKIAYSPEGAFMKNGILHGVAYCTYCFLECLDLASERHRDVSSTALNRQKHTEVHATLIKPARTGPGL